MEKKQIIFTKRGNIHPTDKTELKENGIIIIEVDDLSALKTVNEIENDIVLECAMNTIKESVGVEKTRFFDKFFVKYLNTKGK
jgi:hypothetical protein